VKVMAASTRRMARMAAITASTLVSVPEATLIGSPPGSGPSAARSFTAATSAT